MLDTDCSSSIVKRRERKLRQEEDAERMRLVEKKRRNWDMLKVSMEFLRENGAKWQTRKIEEVARIKEEEKKDRLAICKEKKKRYGIKKLNEEENLRLKRRTEERISVSQAKANYWKQHRSGGGGGMENREDWKRLREGILALEEDGGWIKEEDALKKEERDEICEER